MLAERLSRDLVGELAHYLGRISISPTFFASGIRSIRYLSGFSDHYCDCCRSLSTEKRPTSEGVNGKHFQGTSAAPRISQQRHQRRLRTAAVHASFPGGPEERRSKSSKWCGTHFVIYFLTSVFPRPSIVLPRPGHESGRVCLAKLSSQEGQVSQ